MAAMMANRIQNRWALDRKRRSASWPAAPGATMRAAEMISPMEPAMTAGRP